MSSLPLVFAHGLEGAPQGTKISALRAGGLNVVAPDGRGLPLAERIAGLDAATAAGGVCSEAAAMVDWRRRGWPASTLSDSLVCSCVPRRCITVRRRPCTLSLSLSLRPYRPGLSMALTMTSCPSASAKHCSNAVGTM